MARTHGRLSPWWPQGCSGAESAAATPGPCRLCQSHRQAFKCGMVPHFPVCAQFLGCAQPAEPGSSSGGVCQRERSCWGDKWLGCCCPLWNPAEQGTAGQGCWGAHGAFAPCFLQPGACSLNLLQVLPAQLHSSHTDSHGNRVWFLSGDGVGYLENAATGFPKGT